MKNSQIFSVMLILIVMLIQNDMLILNAMQILNAMLIQSNMLLITIKARRMHSRKYFSKNSSRCNATDNLLADSYYDISQMLDNNTNAQNSHSLNREHKTVRATIILGRHYNYIVTVHKQLLYTEHKQLVSDNVVYSLHYSPSK